MNKPQLRINAAMVKKNYLTDNLLRRIEEHDIKHYSAVPFAERLLLLLANNRYLAAAQFVEPNFKFGKIEKYCDMNKNPVLVHAEKYIESYLQKKKYRMPELDMSGYTVHELKIYMQLLKVPFGATISYGKLAHDAGLSKAARFAGNTMAKNRLPFFVPCHRVIKSNGATGNYTGGTDIKEYLLRHESSG